MNELLSFDRLWLVSTKATELYEWCWVTRPLMLFISLLYSFHANFYAFADSMQSHSSPNISSSNAVASIKSFGIMTLGTFIVTVNSFSLVIEVSSDWYGSLYFTLYALESIIYTSILLRLFPDQSGLLLIPFGTSDRLFGVKSRRMQQIYTSKEIFR